MSVVRKSLRLRLLVGAAIWVSAALVAAGLLIASLLRDFVESSFDERLNTNLVAVISAVQFNESGSLEAGSMATEPRFSQPLSGWYWQIANGHSIVLRSPSLWDAGFDVATGIVGTRSVLALHGPSGEDLRAIARDFTAPGGGEALRITVAGPQTEIDAALDTVVRPLMLSLAILGAGLIAAVLLQTALGLRPLDALRHSLSQVRSGKALAVPDAGYAELQPVIAELNGLIEHNRAVIERARTHVGNLAHGLKTPLAVLANEAARPERDMDGSMAASIGTMERLVQHHLKRARQAGSRDVIGNLTPVAPVLDELAAAMHKIYADRELALTLAVPSDLTFAGERHDFEEIAGNLFDNACKWAGSRVTVTVERRDAWLIARFEDDGPGMPEDAREAAPSRGLRLDQNAPGHGLGLAIVADLAQLYGGDLELGASRLGGLAARLRLPAA